GILEHLEVLAGGGRHAHHTDDRLSIATGGIRDFLRIVRDNSCICARALSVHPLPGFCGKLMTDGPFLQTFYSVRKSALLVLLGGICISWTRSKRCTRCNSKRRKPGRCP